MWKNRSDGGWKDGRLQGVGRDRRNTERRKVVPLKRSRKKEAVSKVCVCAMWRFYLIRSIISSSL
jgi:hypothetical protein